MTVIMAPQAGLFLTFIFGPVYMEIMASSLHRRYVRQTCNGRTGVTSLPKPLEEMSREHGPILIRVRWEDTNDVSPMLPATDFETYHGISHQVATASSNP